MSDVESDGSEEMKEQDDEEVYDDEAYEKTILEMKKIVSFFFTFLY